MNNSTPASNPTEVIIKYSLGNEQKIITLGPDDSAEILAIYARQRQMGGTTLGETKIERTVKPNLLKRIDDFLLKLFTGK